MWRIVWWKMCSRTQWMHKSSLWYARMEDRCEQGGNASLKLLSPEHQKTLGRKFYSDTRINGPYGILIHHHKGMNYNWECFRIYHSIAIVYSLFIIRAFASQVELPSLLVIVYLVPSSISTVSTLGISSFCGFYSNWREGGNRWPDAKPKRRSSRLSRASSVV